MQKSYKGVKSETCCEVVTVGRMSLASSRPPRSLARFRALLRSEECDVYEPNGQDGRSCQYLAVADQLQRKAALLQVFGGSLLLISSPNCMRHSSLPRSSTSDAVSHLDAAQA
jgi:hypothetical protein